MTTTKKTEPTKTAPKEPKKSLKFSAEDVSNASGNTFTLRGRPFDEGSTVSLDVCGLQLQAVVRWCHKEKCLPSGPDSDVNFAADSYKTSFAVVLNSERSHTDWAGRPEALRG